MLSIQTQCLRLIAATAEMACADIENREQFSILLNAKIPDSWPIEVMKDAQVPLAKALEDGSTVPGWSMWYIMYLKALCGVIGFYSKPDTTGSVTVGYGIVPEWERRGIATEALEGLVDWAAATGEAKSLRATTFEYHPGSIRVLEKNQFVCKGVSPDDAEVSDSDRQGRGRLMIWERSLAEN